MGRAEEGIKFLKISVNVYQSKQRETPEDLSLHQLHCQNLVLPINRVSTACPS
jgi:hypothetical protein